MLSKHCHKEDVPREAQSARAVREPKVRARTPVIEKVFLSLTPFASPDTTVLSEDNAVMTRENSSGPRAVSRSEAIAPMGAAIASLALAETEASGEICALRMVGAGNIFSVAALCGGSSAGALARTLLASPPITMQCEDGGQLTWRQVPLQQTRTADLLVRLGGGGLGAWSPRAAPDSLQIDVRGLAAAGGDHAQLLALRDFAEGLNVGPWYLTDYEDLRCIFGEAGARRIDVGLGAHPEEAVNRAAGASGPPPWVAATAAFITSRRRARRSAPWRATGSTSMPITRSLRTLRRPFRQAPCA
jgi:hypothetical protein